MTGLVSSFHIQELTDHCRRGILEQKNKKEGLIMNKKLIGAEPYYCVTSNLNVILEVFEDDIITDDIDHPIKVVQFFECLSSDSIQECQGCPNNRK